MTTFSVGDLARSYQMQRHTHQLKTAISLHSTEVTTGVTADLSRAVEGNFSPVAGVERALKSLEGYKTATTDAAAFATTLQTTLETVQSLGSGVASGLLLAATSSSPDLVAAAGSDALERFRSAISTLNTRVADRTLLAGAATDGPAVASADTILAALAMATASETGAVGVEQVVSDWFRSPSGFATAAYEGSATEQAPFQIGTAEEIEIGVTALDPDLLEMLTGFAMAAMVGSGTFDGNLTEKSHLARRAGEWLLASDSGMANLRARVGAVEARIDEAATRNTAEVTTLQLALNDIIGVDSYDAASALEERQTQLETLYTITARLSRLNLADFLR